MIDNTLTELCQDLRNWFEQDKYFSTFTISSYKLDAPFLMEGQYYRIVGSVFNDGIHRYSENTRDVSLRDETFTGAVWAMAVPPDFLALVQEIEDWNTNARPKMLGPYSSENLSSSGYSYQRQSAEDMAKAADYKTVFGARLNKWRKL